jgi:hypothetical protein
VWAEPGLLAYAPSARLVLEELKDDELSRFALEHGSHRVTFFVTWARARPLLVEHPEKEASIS